MGEEKELKHYGDSLDRLRGIAKKRRQEEDKAAVEKKKKAENLASKKVSITRYRNGQDLMRLPLFSIKNARNGRQFEPFEYVSNDGLTSFKVSPSRDFGMADQMDANIIRLVISKAREVKFLTGYTPKSVKFTPYEILKALGRSDSKNNYKWLISALKRLSSTHYSGNILDTKHFGGTLVSFLAIKQERTSVITIELQLVLKDYIDNDKYILAIDDSILVAKSNLYIRVCELVQVHMGNSFAWSIGLIKLKNLCGSSRELKDFRTDIINSKVPYKIIIGRSKNNELMVTFERITSINNSSKLPSVAE